MRTPGRYQGQMVSDAREKVVAQLEVERVLEKIEDFSHAVGHCERCDDVVEPIVSDQWYIKMKPLVQPAVDAVVDGRIGIVRSGSPRSI